MSKKVEVATRFGVRLRELRLAAGLTQAELAEGAGVSVNFISLMERGIKSPTLNTIERLSTVLKVPIIELFRFDSSSGD